MERNIRLLAVFNFFSDFQLYSAILVLYYAKITGSYTLAMSLFSAAMLSSSIFEIPTGLYSDIIGRKKTVILGSIFSIAAGIFLAIGINYWYLLIGAIFSGLARSWFSGNNDALLHDSLHEIGKKDSYDHYLGRLSSMFQLALAVGAALGSIIASFSFSLVMWLSVIPQIICLGIALLLKEPSRKDRQTGNIFALFLTSAKLLWKNKILRLLSLQDTISYALGESSFEFRAAFFASLWPVWALGFSKMFSFIGGTLSFWYSGKIIKKIGGFKVLLISRIYNRLINFVSLIFPTILSPMLMTTTSLGYGVTSVATNSLMQKNFTDRERATLSSTNSFYGSIAFGIVSVLLGYAADTFNPRSALIIVEIASLSLVFITWKLLKLAK